MFNDLTRQYKRTTLVVGLCLGVMSVINYLKIYLDLGVAGVIEKIIDVYRTVIGFLLGWLDPHLQIGLSYLSECCHISLPLPTSWRDVFVPTFFYFSKDGFVYFAKKMPGGGTFSLAIGAAIALVASVLGGQFHTVPREGIFVFVVAFTLYEMLGALYYGIFIGYKDNSWLRVFSYQFLTRVLTTAILGVLIIAVLLQYPTTPYIGPLLLLVYVAALGIRDITLSIWVTLLHPREYAGQSAKERLTRQGNWKLGTSIIATILVAAGLTIWSGG